MAERAGPVLEGGGVSLREAAGRALRDGQTAGFDALGGGNLVSGHHVSAWSGYP